MTSHLQDARSDEASYALCRLPWRVGRQVGRTVYVQLGDAPHEEDLLIGVMDTAALAAEAVASHNEALERRERRRP